MDLGSFPGGWTQVASQIIKGGKIMSIDIREMEPINNVNFVKGNILESKIKNKINSYFVAKLDVILSDMAADTTGSKSLTRLELINYVQM